VWFIESRHSAKVVGTLEQTIEAGGGHQLAGRSTSNMDRIDPMEAGEF
jgi:hypothetical protein